MYSVDTGYVYQTSVGSFLDIVKPDGMSISRLLFSSLNFTSATVTVSSPSLNSLGATTCFLDSFYCVSARVVSATGVRFDLSNLSGTQNEYSL